jgi:hypothetical protein
MPIDITANVTLKHDNEATVLKKREHKKTDSIKEDVLRQLLDIT